MVASPASSSSWRYVQDGRLPCSVRLLTRSQFVQCLANPAYLNHLATQKILDSPEFIAYLGYLQYFAQPKYAKFLQYVL